MAAETVPGVGIKEVRPLPEVVVGSVLLPREAGSVATVLERAPVAPVGSRPPLFGVAIRPPVAPSTGGTTRVPVTARVPGPF